MTPREREDLWMVVLAAVALGCGSAILASWAGTLSAAWTFSW